MHPIQWRCPLLPLGTWMEPGCVPGIVLPCAAQDCHRQSYSFPAAGAALASLYLVTCTAALCTSLQLDDQCIKELGIAPEEYMDLLHKLFVQLEVYLKL